jgi:hypothetical protein
VDITDVVDDKSKSEGLLIGGQRESILDLLVVSSGSVVTSLSEEISQSIESLNVINGVRSKSRVVGDVFSNSVDVRLVNEVPSVLPGVSLTLNDISKSSAFDKRMTSLSRSEVGVMSLKRIQHFNSSRVYCGVFNLKEIVRSSSSY